MVLRKFTESFLKIFNNVIDTISYRIEKELIKDKDILKYKNNLTKAFNNKDIDIQYDKDSEGKVYLNKQQKEVTGDDKKKKLAFK